MRISFVGAFCAWLVGWLPVNWWQWWALVLVLSAVVFYLLQEQVKTGCRFLVISCLCVLSLISFSYAQMHGQKQLPHYLHKQQVLVSGCYQVLSVHPRSIRLSLHAPHIAFSGLSDNATKLWQKTSFINSYMQLSVYDADMIEVLQARPQGALVAQAVLSKPRNYHNPGGFDYVAWSQRQGQIARGYLKQNLVSWSGCDLSGISWLDEWRQVFLQRIQNIPNEGMGQVLWSALVAGDSSGLLSHQWQTLHRTGTTHLLVISGLHIGLVAVLLMWLGQQVGLLLGYLFGFSSSRELGVWLGWGGALAYAVFSGWGLPAQRAMIMLSAIMLVNRWGLGWSIWQRLGLAWVCTLILNPYSIYSPGFWYSYVAVANLALVIQQDSVKQPSWQRLLWSAIWSQLALLALLTPLIAISTGGLSLIGPFLNLLLIPLFGLLVVPLLLVASLVLNVMAVDHWLIVSVVQGLDLLWQLLDWAATLPHAMLSVGHWPWVVWVMWGLLGGVALVLGYFSLPLLMVLMLTLFQATKFQQQMTIFDIGQGLSIWLQEREQNLLYDLGDRFSSGFNLFDAVVLPSLRAAGVTKLKQVYIGHWDRDHSGGLQALARQGPSLEVNKWWLPSEPRDYLEVYVPAAAKTQRCISQAWQSFGRFKLRQISLWQHGLRGNNASCVLQVEWLGQRILIAGDIEQAAEKMLVELYGDSLRSDILIAPHHGSKTSSSTLFLQAVAPRVVIISAGYGNRFGHPHKQVLERYWQNGLDWYNTAQHGQIRILANHQGRLVVEHTYN